MKNKFSYSILLVAAITALGSNVRAEEEGKNHPCKAVHEACEAAGFKKGDHKDKKGLYLDCVNPLLKGESVQGVTVQPDAVAACKAMKEQHHK